MSAESAAQPAKVKGEATADLACASCHREIYEKYRKTPMANASGPAAEGFLAANFTHAASGVSYRIQEQEGAVYLRFSRAQQGAGAETVPALDGERQLRYFLGSGKRGRTYLFEDQRYWFEIPINWYAKKKIWDMAPNYLNAAQMPLTLPVDPGCLRCHASEPQPSLPEARNRYAGEPFLEGGITCVACHGDPAAHLASGGKVPLMKIDAIAPERRDSVCLNCHLEGEDAVVHQGKRLVDFKPGDNIFDYASFFVRSLRSGGGGRATSQWEALLESGCKRGAGNKLTCTSCHDPHGSTAAMTREERGAYYRARCLSCHDAGATPGKSGMEAGFAATHHPETPDCTTCHMPRAASSDIAHEQVTDHRIPRVAGSDPGKRTAGRNEELVAVSAWRDGLALHDEAHRGMDAAGAPTRDLGLAYAMEAAKGDRGAVQPATELLKQAERDPEGRQDYELHAQLGFLEQLTGQDEAAEREYGLALAANAHDSFAAGNLALLLTKERRYGQAVGLWERWFQENPVEIKTGMNLATVQCGLGKREAALATLDRILHFSPDERQARRMSDEIRSNVNACPAR